MSINKEIKSLKTKYKFVVDHGSFETAIEFTAIGYHHPPKSNSWEEAEEQGNQIICPDLLDYKNKTVLEFEEEGQKRRSGAHLASKGHGPQGDLTNNRDTNRDHLYRIGGFKLLKIYESEWNNGTWKEKLKQFLT